VKSQDHASLAHGRFPGKALINIQELQQPCHFQWNNEKTSSIGSLGANQSLELAETWE
jgi:hypothetical protein